MNTGNTGWKCLAVFVLSYALFFALSPGVLLTLPKGKGSSCNTFMQLEKDANKNCATSLEAVAAHGAIFAALMTICCWIACSTGMM